MGQTTISNWLVGFLNHQQYHPILLSTKAWWTQWMEWWNLGTGTVGTQLVKIVDPVGENRRENGRAYPGWAAFFSQRRFTLLGEIFSEKSWSCVVRSKESMWVDRSQISFDVTLSYEHFPFDQQVLDWGWQECGEIPVNEITLKPNKICSENFSVIESWQQSQLDIVSIEILLFFCGTPLQLMINWCFGAWFGILGIPLRIPISFILGDPFTIQRSHHQLPQIMGWLKPLGWLGWWKPPGPMFALWLLVRSNLCEVESTRRQTWTLLEKGWSLRKKRCFEGRKWYSVVSGFVIGQLFLVNCVNRFPWPQIYGVFLCTTVSWEALPGAHTVPNSGLVLYPPME